MCSLQIGSCRKASDRIRDQARNAAPHTPYQYLTPKQLVGKLRTANTQNNTLKLQILNLSKKVARTARRMSDHKRLVFALATHDVPRVHHLIRIAVKQNVGVDEIRSRI
ncbi:hypothetical protein C8J57DRAFT_1076474, partial [Mycena rebaudengoi]